MHRSRKCPSKPNGITVRDSPQPEFCNTINCKADLGTRAPKSENDPKRTLATRKY